MTAETGGRPADADTVLTGLGLAATPRGFIGGLRPCPQHPILYFPCWIGNAFYDEWLRTDALQQKGGSRQRKPRENPVHEIARHRKRERHGDPDAQATETVDQFANKGIRDTRPPSRDCIRRPVLTRQKMRDAPSRKRSKDESYPEIRAIHWGHPVARCKAGAQTAT